MKDLTGVWWQDGGASSDKGEYYMRQVGQSFYATGEPESGHPWKNVLYGTIKGDTIEVEWGDVPTGKFRGSGVFTLTIKDNGDTLELTKYVSGDHFGGQKWTRE